MKLEENKDRIVTMAEGVVVNWGDPSRLRQEFMVANWKSIVSHQRKKGEYKHPFQFFKDTEDTEPRKSTDMYQNVLENERRRLAVLASRENHAVSKGS